MFEELANPETQPDSCKPCPLYGKHQGFCPGRGNLEAPIVYLGEAPGGDEIDWRRCPTHLREGLEKVCPICKAATEPYPFPFVGKSGKLARFMLRTAGLRAENLYITNVLKCRPPDNKYPIGKEREEAEACCSQYLNVELAQSKAKVIIAAGAQALRRLTGHDEISKKRGYVYASGEDFQGNGFPPVVATVHPAFLFRVKSKKKDEDEADVNPSLVSSTVSDYIKAGRIAASGVRRPTVTYQGVRFLELAQEIVRSGSHVSLDLEYTPKGKITHVGLGRGDGIYVLDWSHATDEDAAVLMGILRNQVIVGHNVITADLPVLEANGLLSGRIEDVIGSVYDTMLAQHLLYPDEASGMDYWGSIVTDLAYWKDMLEGGGNIFIYCGYDVHGADRLYETGSEQLKDMEMSHLLPIQQAAQLALYRMEERGVAIDAQRLPEIESQIDSEIAELEKLSPVPNWKSNKQLHEYYTGLYGKLPYSRATSKPTLDKHALFRLAKNPDEGGKFAKTLLTLRELSKLKNTYVEPYRELAGSSERAIIHSRFSVTQSGTGRTTSSGPNLYQIPKRSQRAKELIRSLIVPRHEGWVLVEADWEQEELRLAVKFSGARRLQEMLDNGVDIHQLYADKYGKSRDMAKIAIYGGNYMLTAPGLAERFDMDEADIAPVLYGYLKENPEIPAWWKTVEREVKVGQGVLRLPFRRIRRFYGKPSDWIREAVSTVPQGTGADMLLRVLPVIERESVQHLQARMLLAPHDAILMECPVEEVKQVSELLKDTMERAWPELDGLRVPVGIKVGKNWAAMKKE